MNSEISGELRVAHFNEFKLDEVIVDLFCSLA